MKHQAEGVLDAAAIAKATIQTLSDLNVTLAPIIGEVGVEVLFKRSIYLTSKTFPWLITTEHQGGTSDLLASLNLRLAERDKNEAIEASSVLLTGFTELLTTLLGDSLVATLLGSLDEPLALSSNQIKVPKQDTMP
jgi:hypothetical protein